MIEIKARTRGDTTELEVHISGSAEEIGLETAHIVTQLPEQLLEKCYPGFLIMKDKVKEISEDVRKECVKNKLKEMETEERDAKRN